MDAKEFIQRQMKAARDVCGAGVLGVTDEQFNWQPPCEAISIKAALIHLLVGEDFFVQGLIQGRPLLWDTGGWAAKTGVKIAPGGGVGWDEIRDTPVSLASVLPYQQAVQTATDAYVAALTPEELDRQIDLFGSQQPVAQALAVVIAHTAEHAGDIAAVKGMQGIKGLPY